MKRRAVVQANRRAAREPADEPVPHHPAARREEQQALVGGEIAMQQLFLPMLQQRAADAVHDALRYAGRAGREHDVQRRRERQPHERPAAVSNVPTTLRRRVIRLAASRVEPGCRPNYHGATNARQSRRDLSEPRGAVEPFAGVVVAVAADQQLRLDLSRNDRRWPTRRNRREHELHTAPSAVVASIAMTVSMRFGTTAATRSPAPMPRSCRCAATRCNASTTVLQT